LPGRDQVISGVLAKPACNTGHGNPGQDSASADDCEPNPAGKTPRGNIRCDRFA